MQCCPAMTRRRGNKSHPLLTSPLSETQVSGYRRRLRLHALSPWNDLTNRQRAARTETRGVPSEQGRVMYRIPPLPSMPFNASSPGIREDGVLKKKKKWPHLSGRACVLPTCSLPDFLPFGDIRCGEKYGVLLRFFLVPSCSCFFPCFVPAFPFSLLLILAFSYRR